MIDTRLPVGSREGGNVCKINCVVAEGLIPSERVVRFEVFDGSLEEVAVSERHIDGNTLLASEIGSDGERVLVELPRESSSGRWRVWVRANQIGR